MPYIGTMTQTFIDTETGETHASVDTDPNELHSARFPPTVGWTSAQGGQPCWLEPTVDAHAPIRRAIHNGNLVELQPHVPMPIGARLATAEEIAEVEARARGETP